MVSFFSEVTTIINTFPQIPKWITKIMNSQEFLKLVGVRGIPGRSQDNAHCTAHALTEL